MPIRRAVRALLGMILGAAFVFLVWWLVPPACITPWVRDPIPAEWATWSWQDAPVRTHYVPLERISLDLQAAVIAGEDIGFFTHRGIDWGAVREAIEEWKDGKGLRGASTITQQLARNLFLSPRRDFVRKLREARLAHWMEKRFGKRRILELYLNVVEFGDGLLGAAAASEHYYGIPPDSLTLDQAAGIAAALPSPAADNPGTGTRAWNFRKEIIRARLRAYGWVRERILTLFTPEHAAVLASKAPPPADSLGIARERLGAWLDSVFTSLDSVAASPDSALAKQDSLRLPPPLRTIPPSLAPR